MTTVTGYMVIRHITTDTIVDVVPFEESVQLDGAYGLMDYIIPSGINSYSEAWDTFYGEVCAIECELVAQFESGVSVARYREFNATMLPLSTPFDELAKLRTYHEISRQLA